MSVFTNQTRNTASFSNSSKSDQTLFGDLTPAVIGNLSPNDMFMGKLLGDWAPNDIVGTRWSLQTRN